MVVGVVAVVVVVDVVVEVVVGSVKAGGSRLVRARLQDEPSLYLTGGWVKSWVWIGVCFSPSVCRSSGCRQEL